jgi:hypothetical protein
MTQTDDLHSVRVLGICSLVHSLIEVLGQHSLHCSGCRIIAVAIRMTSLTTTMLKRMYCTMTMNETKKNRAIHGETQQLVVQAEDGSQNGASRLKSSSTEAYASPLLTVNSANSACVKLSKLMRLPSTRHPLSACIGPSPLEREIVTSMLLVFDIGNNTDKK